MNLLDQGTTVTVARPLRCEVHCVLGALWITHDGDPKDIVVEAGHSYLVDRSARMLVSALEDSKYVLTREGLSRPAAAPLLHAAAESERTEPVLRTEAA